MDATEFEEDALWRAVAGSGARALLIGRQALVLLGAPVGTFDYDFWVHADDAERLNRAVEHLGLFPNRSPDEARQKGRYVLENDMRVDVLVARAVTTIDGRRVAFEEIWPRRQLIQPLPGVDIAVPCVEDLIETKKFGARAKDLEDIAFLRLLLGRRDA